MCKIIPDPFNTVQRRKGWYMYMYMYVFTCDLHRAHDFDDAAVNLVHLNIECFTNARAMNQVKIIYQAFFL